MGIIIPKETLDWIGLREGDEVNLEQREGGIFLKPTDEEFSRQIARPVNEAARGESDLIILGAAYLFGLARNHAFPDGNKRVAIATAGVFLERNGIGFVASDHAPSTISS